MIAAMQSWADQQTAILRERHPGWDVWFVPKTGRGYWWCARPKGTPVATIQASSPEELAELVECYGLRVMGPRQTEPQQ
jgi:hypothetical protein